MVEGSGEASNIGDDTTSDDEDWLVSGDSVVLHVNEDGLNILDVLVDLVTGMDQLGKWDFVGIEIGLELFTEEGLNLVVNDGDASTKGLVDL